ncbi:uncharacterized protein LOC119096192 [Pollicipes pollicipes]|uniref:uncharacterized protein LOC119096192 n=1 Tax=Pollicipes pollicipes TaxID=41117 RepID=UPI0018849B18|nr:uncharacterized protein LOC119096192 [Pollicipes pollicipes]
MALNRRALSELCFVVVMLAAAVAGEGSVLGAAGRHPLAKPSSCHAFGPQAIMEVLREKVDDVNKDQLDKYVNILKYLRAVPEILDRYLLGQGIATEHGAVLAEFETTLQQRLQVVRLDVLLPWVRLLKLQELAEQSGRLQQAAATALAINLRLALNSTKTTKQNILDSVHGLVDQYRGLFLNYKIIMDMWVENAWPDDSPEEKEEIVRHIYMHVSHFEEYTSPGAAAMYASSETRLHTALQVETAPTALERPNIVKRMQAFR